MTAFLEYPLVLDDLAADEALFVVGVLAAPPDANGVYVVAVRSRRRGLAAGGPVRPTLAARRRRRRRRRGKTGYEEDEEKQENVWSMVTLGTKMTHSKTDGSV